MKVLIIAPYFFERHRWMISAYKTALNLSKKIEVVVLTTGTPTLERINDRLIVYRLRDIFLPDPINFSIVPGLLWGLERVLAREKPDIILVNKHMFFTSLVVPWLKLRNKKVIVATDTFPGINWFPKNPVVKLVMIIYARLIGMPILKIADRVVLLHEGLIGIAQKYGLRFQVIHNGVDLAQIKKIKPIKLAGRIKVGYIGRLESIKGYELFLRLAREITEKDYDLHFYLVGNIDNKQTLLEGYKNFPNIHFLGHRDDVPNILKSLDIVILPSYSEGLPNSLMEAMAAGCACIAAAVGGVKILIKDEKNGLLFSPNDYNGLKRRSMALINDPQERVRLGRAASKTIARYFDWRMITQQYLALFRDFV